jgi:hypothetical protein
VRRFAAGLILALVLIVGGMVGYDMHRKSSSALLARARTAAMMPSCRGAHATWLREREGGVDAIQFADIRADADCMAAWAAALGRPGSQFNCDTQKGHLRCSNLPMPHQPSPAEGAAVDFMPDRAQLLLWS